MSAEGVFDPEVYGEPVYTDNQSDTEVYGELGDDVTAITAGYGQAQADILQTYQAYGQAQADIKQTSQVYGQSQADIKATYQGYAQAQADILHTYQGYAQCQADILHVYQGYGQAQAKIPDGTQQAYGQAQGDIKAIGYGFGQGQADIKQVYQGYGQSQGDILAISRAYGQTQADINAKSNGYGQAQADILVKINKFAQSQGYIKTIAQGYGQAQATILEAPHGYAFAQASADIIVAGNNKLAQATASIDSPIKVQWACAQAYILKSAGYGQASAFIHRSEVQAQAAAQIKHEKNQVYAQARAYITKTKKHGQAQAKIKATNRGFGQAQAYIPPKATGQAQARIAPATAKKFAQANALITRSIVFAQARSWIETTNNTSAQAQAKIKSIANKRFGQAQAAIKSIAGQPGQAQAQMISNPTVYGQATTYIDNGSPVVIIEDMLADAHTYDLTGITTVATVDLTNYTLEATDADPIFNGSNPADGTWDDEFSGNPPPAPNGWFYFTLTQPSIVHLNTFEFLDTNHDTVLGIFTGDSGPGNWTVIAGNDDDFGTYESEIDVTLFVGTYLVIVGLYGYVLQGITNLTLGPEYGFVHLNIFVEEYAIVGNGQAQALISQPTQRMYAQAQAYLGAARTGQAQAYIKTTASRSGQAKAEIRAINNRVFGQARVQIKKVRNNVSAQSAAIITTTKPSGQAQARIIIYPRKYAQAQARVNGYYTAQGQAQAFIAFSTKSGQAQAFIRRNISVYAQAQAYIHTDVPVSPGKPLGQAQAYIQSERYTVKYNDFHLPGYAQEETIDMNMRIKSFGVAYQDYSLTEYQGLENKIASLRLKVVGENYLDCKNQIEMAATIIRTNRDGFVPLYIQYLDRHFEALAQSIKLEANTSNIKTADYTVAFETKPWLISDTLTTLTGTGTVQTTGRTLDNGGWTPTTIRVTGTNVTISGYTATGDFTGFVSISGAVTNFVIDTEEYEATNNRAMLNSDYQIYVGPGVTSFDITGATNCTITYRDRWYL